MENIGLKLSEFLKNSNLTQKEVAEQLGTSPAYINAVLGNRTRIGKRQAEKLSNLFGLSKGWLLTGEGEMLQPPCNNMPETRPRIPYDAAAGTITESMEGVTSAQCEQIPVIPIFPRYDFTIRIYGDSMEPEYHSGDEVACLNINTTHFIQWGRVHVLDTMQGIVIKRIYEDGDYIRCRSYNKDYPDFLVPKKEIRSFNLVVGSLRI
jgi:phage repressor protein C with HTH and peptisase S24 domain